MKCRFIDTSKNDAYLNMAIDEALLLCSKEPVLRVYQWSPSSVSVGYSQSVSQEINVSECRKNNVDIVRRITGGKAVFHDDELTYSFIVPKNTIRLPNGVAESYRVIASALLLAFHEIGVKAEMKNVPEKIAFPSCFSSSNWYEIFAGGKKICGSAQKRVDEKILQHGSMLIDFDYEKNKLFFKQANSEILRKKVTCIKNELKKNISYNRLAKSLRRGFEKIFNIRFINDSLSDREMSEAYLLRKEKYSQDKWNFRI